MNNRYRVLTYDYGKEEHYYDDKLHNEYGPAVVYRGYQEIYYKHGVIHREEGPAIITNSNKNNFKLEWYFEGKRHRDDGPSVIEGNGNLEYWINGEKNLENNFVKEENTDSDYLID